MTVCPRRQKSHRTVRPQASCRLATLPHALDAFEAPQVWTEEAHHSNKKLLGTSASPLVTSALLVVTRTLRT